MYNERYIKKMIRIFRERTEKNYKVFLESDQYAMIKYYKGEKISEYSQRVFQILKDSLPEEIDLGYLYLKRFTEEDKLKISIRGDVETIGCFDETETFTKEDEQGIFEYMFNVFSEIIFCEYGAENINIVNEYMAYLKKESGILYDIIFNLAFNPERLIQEITNTKVVINVDVQRAIDIADTVLFTGAINILDQSERSKTKYTIRKDLISQLKQIKTTPLFIESDFCIYSYLTKKTKHRNTVKEIQKVHKKEISDLGQNENGIGFEQTKYSFGYMQKTGTSYEWVLHPFNKKTLEDM